MARHIILNGKWFRSEYNASNIMMRIAVDLLIIQKIYFKKSFISSFNPFLILPHSSVPKSTTKKIISSFQIALNTGTFLNKKSTPSTTKKTIIPEISSDVSGGGEYDSRKKFITFYLNKFKKKNLPKQKNFY